MNSGVVNRYDEDDDYSDGVKEEQMKRRRGMMTMMKMLMQVMEVLFYPAPSSILV